jgi:hypothetical protein
MEIWKWFARNKIGRPSRPRLGLRGHVNEGNSGGAGGVATTPKEGVTLPAVVVVGLVVVPVGGAKELNLN